MMKLTKVEKIVVGFAVVVFTFWVVSFILYIVFGVITPD